MTLESNEPSRQLVERLGGRSSYGRIELDSEGKPYREVKYIIERV